MAADEHVAFDRFFDIFQLEFVLLLSVACRLIALYRHNLTTENVCRTSDGGCSAEPLGNLSNAAVVSDKKR